MNRNKRRNRKQKNHRNFIIAILLLTISVCVVSCSKSEKPPEYISYIVQDGDTLWEIASYYSNDSIDVREVIRQIEMKNSLSGAMIYCGDELLVPNYCKSNDISGKISKFTKGGSKGCQPY